VPERLVFIDETWTKTNMSPRPWRKNPDLRGSALRRAIRAAGARLVFLPPYSPDLNPIEQAFAKLNTLIRKAEERTVDGLWRRIGGSLEAFTPRECANHRCNAGYASPLIRKALAPGPISGKFAARFLKFIAIAAQDVRLGHFARPAPVIEVQKYLAYSLANLDRDKRAA
jgi:hypothetical protein